MMRMISNRGLSQPKSREWYSDSFSNLHWRGRIFIMPLIMTVNFVRQQHISGNVSSDF